MLPRLPASVLPLLLALGVALVAAGCESSHGLLTLTIDVQTDLVPSYEFAFVEVVVSDGAGGCDESLDGIYQRGRVAVLGDARSFRAGLRVGEITDLSPGPYTVRATLRRPPSDPASPPDTGPVLVRRCIATVMTASRVVRLHLTSECIGVECPAPGGSAAFTECLAGRCVDPRCDPADPTTYEEFCCDRRDSSIDCDAARFCLEDSDCEPIASCASARCDIAEGEEGGVCVNDEEIPGVCGPGTYCSRETGACAPIPTPGVDGGVSLDAGVVVDAPTEPIDAPVEAIDAPVEAIDASSGTLDAGPDVVDAAREEIDALDRTDAWTASDAGGPARDCLDPDAVYTPDGCVLRDVASCSPFMPCPASYACQRLSDGTDRCVCSSPTVCGPACASSAECAATDPGRPVCRRGACYPEFGCLGWWSSPIFCGVDETCGDFSAGCVAAPTGAGATGAACGSGADCASGQCRRFSGFPSSVCVESCDATSECSVGTCLIESGPFESRPVCAPPATVPAGCASCTTSELCLDDFGGVECVRSCRTTSECGSGEVCRVQNSRQFGTCVSSALSCSPSEFMIDVDSGRSQGCSTDVACIDGADCSGAYSCQTWAFGGASGMVTTCTRTPD